MSSILAVFNNKTLPKSIFFVQADHLDEEGNKHRRSKQPVPDSNKDEKYWRRREKNNLVFFVKFSTVQLNLKASEEFDSCM